MNSATSWILMEVKLTCSPTSPSAVGKTTLFRQLSFIGLTGIRELDSGYLLLRSKVGPINMGSGDIKRQKCEERVMQVVKENEQLKLALAAEEKVNERMRTDPETFRYLEIVMNEQKKPERQRIHADQPLLLT
uniref:Uncharacterized protein n=1 Tax=Onchocerca volvulus TaxID=6282 RepID=A0A8R1XUY2_ONCVO